MRGFHVEESDVPAESWDGRDGSALIWRTLVGGVGGVGGHSSGITAGVTELQPHGGLLELHRHSPPEVYHVIAGAGTVTVGDDRFHVRPGSTVYIPGSTWHAIETTGPDVLRIFYCFPTDRFTDVAYEYATDA